MTFGRLKGGSTSKNERNNGTKWATGLAACYGNDKAKSTTMQFRGTKKMLLYIRAVRHGKGFDHVGIFIDELSGLHINTRVFGFLTDQHG